MFSHSLKRLKAIIAMQETVLRSQDAIIVRRTKERDIAREQHANTLNRLLATRADLDDLLGAAERLYAAHAPSEPRHPLWDALRDAIEAVDA